MLNLSGEKNIKKYMQIYSLSNRKEAQVRKMTYTTVFLRTIGNLSKSILNILPCLKEFVDTDVIDEKMLKFEDKVN